MCKLDGTNSQQSTSSKLSLIVDLMPPACTKLTRKNRNVNLIVGCVIGGTIILVIGIIIIAVIFRKRKATRPWKVDDEFVKGEGFLSGEGGTVDKHHLMNQG